MWPPPMEPSSLSSTALLSTPGTSSRWCAIPTAWTSKESASTPLLLPTIASFTLSVWKIKFFDDTIWTAIERLVNSKWIQNEMNGRVCCWMNVNVDSLRLCTRGAFWSKCTDQQKTFFYNNLMSPKDQPPKKGSLTVAGISPSTSFSVLTKASATTRLLTHCVMLYFLFLKCFVDKK